MATRSASLGSGRRHGLRLTPTAAIALLIFAATGTGTVTSGQTPVGVAHLLLDLNTGRTLSSSGAGVIDTPLLPGSIVKMATLIAALESRTITPATRLTCSRVVRDHGVNATCAHPDLGRGLSAEEALAHSCNSFFATIAQRLPRAALNRTFIRLGLPAIPSDTASTVVALGLGPPRVPPRALLEALVRIAGPRASATMREETRATLRRGLQAAGTEGTAAVFSRRGVTALAKTGTSPMPGGGYLGLVVALSPSDAPALGIVVVVPGGAGMDAADIAAELIAERLGEAEGERASPGASEEDGKPTAVRLKPDATTVGAAGTVLRIGVTRQGRHPLVVSRPVEEYVADVVAGEAAPGSRPAVLAALAIAARTYASGNRNRHRSEGFDLCDLTHCQVAGRATASARDAAQSTQIGRAHV